MENIVGRIWVALLQIALIIVVFYLDDVLKPIGTKKGETLFLTALT